MDELISVIVPVYRTQQYLPGCIESILRQTYCNIEILLIEDGSPDRCGELCDMYAEKDSRVRVIHQEHGGLFAARNTGVCLARGRYIAFVDSDDLVAPEFLEVLYEVLHTNQCEISQCGYVRFVKEVPPTVYQKEICCYSGKEMCFHLYNALYVPAVVVWNKLYRRELFREIQFPEGKLHEDEGTTYRLFYEADRVAVTNAPLYYYRRNEQGIMAGGYSLKRLDVVELYQERMEFFKKHKEKELYVKSMLRYWAALARHWALCKKYLPHEKQAVQMLRGRMWKIYPRLLACAPFRKKLRCAAGLLYPRHYLKRLERERDGERGSCAWSPE